MEPGKHYISVKEDMSDLIMKVRWCHANPLEAEKIKQRGLMYAKQHLTQQGASEYLKQILNNLGEGCGDCV